MQHSVRRSPQRAIVAAAALAAAILVAFAANVSAMPAPPAPAVRQQGCPCSIWSDQAVPAVASQDDSQAVELGMKFQTSSPGYIIGIKFYKGSANIGLHLGNLWSRDGQLLARAIFASETASGWQRVFFSTPVAVAPHVTYVASYHTDVGHYALNQLYFQSAGVVSGPLRALADGEDGPNGVFRYGASTFPSETFRSSNYWVDPIFSADVADVVPPAISGVQETDVTLFGATIRWTTDEPSDSRVDFGPTPAYGSSVFDANLVTTHSVQVSGLAPNTGYHLRVQSRDAAGNQASAGDFTLTTAGVIPPAGQCLPRPNVSIAVSRSSPGRLLVVVTARTNASTPSNQLVAVHFLPGTNALIDAGGQLGRTGDFTVALSGQATTFYLRPAVLGTTVMLPLVVIDSCGEFRTFVGGGRSAF